MRSSSSIPSATVRAVTILLLLTSILQTIVFAISTGPWHWAIAGVSALIGWLAFGAVRRRETTRRFLWILLSVVQMLLYFGVQDHLLEHLYWHWYQRLLCGWHIAAAVTIVAGAIVGHSARVALASMTFFTLLALFAVVLRRESVDVRFRSFGGNVELDPDLGYALLPFTIWRQYFPDNPRGYFDVLPFESPWQRPWQLLCGRNIQAELLLPTATGWPLQVRVDGVDTFTPWGIHLQRDSLLGPDDGALSLLVRMRSFPAQKGRLLAICPEDKAKPVAASVELSLREDWQEWEIQLALENRPGEVIFRIDVGSAPGIVEFGNFEARDGRGAPLRPKTEPIATPYSIRYTMNSLGLRDREFDVPRPANVRRIVAIGDSYTFGQGVQTPDTFSKLLEGRLNEAYGRSPRYEVINAGRGGYATRQERILFERIAAIYDPAAVLLVLSSNDADEGVAGAAQGATVGIPKAPDIPGCLDEIEQLRVFCAGRGIALAVAFFRIEWSVGDMSKFIEAVRAYADRKQVPFIDLGVELLRRFSSSSLIVHKMDEHPNAVAHRIAAELLADFFRKNRLVGDAVTD